MQSDSRCLIQQLINAEIDTQLFFFFLNYWPVTHNVTFAHTHTVT